jgi:hypothetical protein
MARLRSRNSPVVEAEFYNKCGFIDILANHNCQSTLRRNNVAIASRSCINLAPQDYRYLCGSRRYPGAKSGLVLVAVEIMRPVESSIHLLEFALLSK